MKPIEGLNLVDLAAEANVESLIEQGERIKRHVRNMNSEINGLLTKKDQLASELDRINKRLQTTIAQRDRVVNGDWGALPDGEPKTPPYDTPKKVEVQGGKE